LAAFLAAILIYTMFKEIRNFLSFEKIKNLLFILFGVCIFFISNTNGMFWDNILFSSKMGNHLYLNSIFDWTIPDQFDPGHPPFLGFLLAISWKILGHTLWAAHLLMLPFTIGVFYQLFKFISYFIEDQKSKILAFLLIIADPTLSTQFVIVNPEVIIVFFFFLAINGILFNNKITKFIGLLLLSIVSFRSMMLFGGVFLFDVLNKHFIERKNLKLILNLKFLLFYFLSCLPGFIFVCWRLLTKGWLQTHPNSPWAGLWGFADLKTFFKNCLLIVHRYVDFGRIFIFLFITISFVFFGKKIIATTKNKQILLIALSSVIFIIIVSLLSTNTFGHRYFIVSYIGFILLAFIILQHFYKSKKILFSLLFVGLISGNLWVYPREMSQGWDATLAHIPYHALRIEAIDYLNKEKIDIEKVASFFPNLTTLDNIDFSTDQRTFLKFNAKNKYVFYSNVYNLTDKQYEILDTNYSVLKEFNKNNITVLIYILKEK
jgi:hypothetical protein